MPQIRMKLPLGLVVVLFLFLSGQALAAVSASVVTSSSQLLGGTRADGQLGDLIIQNDEIVLIIAAIGHVAEYGANGGTVIDAATQNLRSDSLGELYTYFNDDWPRQAHYTDLSIVDNGSGGGPAVIRATGYDTQDAGIAVVTHYSLNDGDRHLQLTTEVTAGSGNLSNFELGDVFHWGSCQKYAPGYGFDVYGTTTEAWMSGLGTNVAYAYAGIYGDSWGPNGSLYSDLNVTTVTIGAGQSASYTRYLAVAEGDIAAAVSNLLEALGTDQGSLQCSVQTQDGGQPISGASVEIYDYSGAIYLPLTTDASGQSQTQLPVGSWRLDASAPGFLPSSQWQAVLDDGNYQVEILMSETGGSSSSIGDTLTVIQRPLVNIPSFVTEGQNLVINCAADPATTGWQAELSYGELTIPLAISSSSYDASTLWWTLNAAVPDVPLYELYDLRVTANGDLDDTTRNAVRVLEEYLDDYYFIHISDTHLPDHQFSDSGGSPADSTEIVDLRAVIEDINLINPEFVLITGDFVNEGELEDYMEWRCYTRAQRMLYEFTCPTFLVAGNHDLGGWNSTPPPAGTSRRDWWRFFGWPRLNDPPPGAPLHTQNYSFDYGSVHFVGLEAYDNYDLWRAEIYGDESFPAEQISWLNADLAAASNSVSQVLFYHYDFQYQLNLTSLGVEMALWGHIHSDQGDENSQPYSLATNNVCDGERSYRLIRVSNGVVQPESSLSAGSSGQNLRVQFTPANNGYAGTVTAQVVNTQMQRFEQGRLRFVMPSAGGNYEVEGGQLVQVDQSGDFDICHVAVDIPAGAISTVTVSPAVSSVPGGSPNRAMTLGPNHPNPFNPSTELAYRLPDAGHLKIAVFDVQGHEVAVLVDEVMAAGEYRARWNGLGSDGRAMPSGVYLVRMVTPGGATSRKIVLAR